MNQQSEQQPAIPSRLNIGCGYDKRAGYLNVDMEPACDPDLLVTPEDDSAIPRGHFVEVHARDVLEHIPRSKTLEALLNWSDYLVDGGRLNLQTSNVEGVIDLMRANPVFDHQFGMTICLFGNQTQDGDFHFTGFTELTLRVHLLAAGFEIDSMETVDGWLLKATARKVEDWTASLGADDLVGAGFQAAFGRDPDPHNRVVLSGVAPKDALRSIWSSPERLYVTARKHGL